MRKRVFITGSAKGIGRGIALAFARNGADLVLHYRSNDAEAESLLQEVSALGASAVPVKADLADFSELEECFRFLHRHWGSLDAAVNNAGWDPGFMPLDEVTEENYYRLTDMNIKGTMFCCLRELELLGDHGSIVNIGSVQMNTTVPGRLLYATSKGAIHSMTGALALECGPRGIRVNAIAPGYIEVERMSGVPDYDRAEVASGIPVRRPGVPADVGELAVFLASDAASFINGETIVIDGGVNRKLARSAM